VITRDRVLGGKRGDDGGAEVGREEGECLNVTGGTQIRRGMNLSYARWIEEDDGNGEQQPSPR
jgi:hypothetical protein